MADELPMHGESNQAANYSIQFSKQLTLKNRHEVPSRNHAGAKTYPIRTSDNTAGIESIVHSDSLQIHPSTVSKAVDPETGEPLACT